MAGTLIAKPKPHPTDNEETWSAEKVPPLKQRECSSCGQYECVNRNAQNTVESVSVCGVPHLFIHYGLTVRTTYDRGVSAKVLYISSRTTVNTCSVRHTRRGHGIHFL